MMLMEVVGVVRFLGQTVKNVIAIRKNFMEKGSRADPIGSNLHS